MTNSSLSTNYLNFSLFSRLWGMPNLKICILFPCFCLYQQVTRESFLLFSFHCLTHSHNLIQELCGIPLSLSCSMCIDIPSCLVIKNKKNPCRQNHITSQSFNPFRNHYKLYILFIITPNSHIIISIKFILC